MKTMTMTTETLRLIFVIFVFIPLCKAISCYVCNSKISSNCGSVGGVTCIGKSCYKYYDDLKGMPTTPTATLSCFNQSWKPFYPFSCQVYFIK